MQRLNYSVALIAAVLALPACRAETAEVGRDPSRSASVQIPPSASEIPGARGDAASPAEIPQPAANAEATTPVGSPAPAAPVQREQTPAPSADAASPADAAQILARVEKTYAGVRSMEADFSQHLSVPLLGSNQQSHGRIFQRRPDRFLMRFSEPAGDIIVADGKSFWMYYPSTDKTQVIRASMTEGGRQADLQQEFLSNATERYVATLAGEEAVDGRPAHVLTLVPKGQSPYKLVKVWVDKGDFLVRRFEITEENESVRRLQLSNVRLNTQMPDSLFQFTPPPGTEVFNQ
jgi:outer membrane lipoprotein carrier protein